jgi:hypothetical protein
VSHEFERLLYHLRQPEVDVTRQLLDNVVGE